MAFGKKKRNYFKTFLKVLLFFVVLGGLGFAGYEYHIGQLNQMETKYTKQIEDYVFQAYSLKKSAYVAKEELTAGTVLSSEMMEKVEYDAAIPQDQFLGDDYMGQTLMVGVPQGQPILMSMVQAEDISGDVREEELNMLFLPSELDDTRYVDVRICFPNGEDYIVLSKKKVREVKLDQNTVWFWLNEQEILTLNSAILDAYIHVGTKLYTVTYVEPAVQEAAVVNYPVNVNVFSVMKSNPNMLEEAKAKLSKDARVMLDARLLVLNQNDKTLVENGIGQEETSRQATIQQATVSTQTATEAAVQEPSAGTGEAATETTSTDTTQEEGASDGDLY